MNLIADNIAYIKAGQRVGVQTDSWKFRGVAAFGDVANDERHSTVLIAIVGGRNQSCVPAPVAALVALDGEPWLRFVGEDGNEGWDRIRCLSFF